MDPWWAPRWLIVWQRTYAVARQWWLESDGRVDWAQLPVETTFEGEQLGRWVRAQRAGWAELDQEQRDLLAALGIEEDQELAAARAAAAAKPKVSRADRFGAGLAALAAFVEREGHVRVPRTHKEDGVSLGSWLNNQKARRDKLTKEQLGQLEALGAAW
ncbi:helicase associated domain-containing protein [Kitasatospora sp. NPDC101155]|uniref:helicase associated domain-containing protein n=1 Tax=Kitasatospora sp. NPDC101155 TaxID=3364097 RepID=UPI0037F937D5